MAKPINAVLWVGIFLLGSFGVGLALAQTSSAGKQQLQGHLMKEWAQAPQVGTLPATTMMSQAIGLPLRNQSELNTLLKAISDPSSPQYRHYLTPEQFTSRFGPTEQDYAKAKNFMQANGLRVTGTYPDRALLDVRGTVADVQKVFHVNLNTYRRRDNSVFYAPDREPSLDLDTVILHVSGLDNYNLPRTGPKRHSAAGTAPKGNKHAHAAKANAGTGSGGAFQGADFRNAYAPGILLTGAGQTVGLFEINGFFQSDINTYESSSTPPITAAAPTTVLVDGFSGTPDLSNTFTQGFNVEESLDIEMVLAMAPGAQVEVFEAPPNETFAVAADDILEAMSNTPVCQELSTSIANFSDPSALQSLEKFAASGQSFFYASGDTGAFGPGDPYAVPTPPGGITSFMTQVGGTELTTNSDGSYASETVWNQTQPVPGSSTGGIATGLAIPSWQGEIPRLPNGASAQWMNIPDVSMTADNIACFDQNNAAPDNLSGTSAAAPLWAGFTALANQEAAALGLNPVGFVNPLIYQIGNSPQYSADFNDITSGNNNESGTEPIFYQAGTGYDLCTGWGSPKANLVFHLAQGTSGFTYSFQPSPILFNQTLGTGQTTPVTLRTVSTSGLPIPFASVYLSFFNYPGGGSASVSQASGPPVALSATGQFFQMDKNGQLVLAYREPAQFPIAGGTDTVWASNGPQIGQWNVTGNDSCFYPTASKFQFLPNPIGFYHIGNPKISPQGTAVEVLLSVQDAQGDPVPFAPVNLTFHPGDPTRGSSATILGAAAATGALGASPLVANTNSVGMILLDYLAPQVSPGQDVVEASVPSLNLDAKDTYTLYAADVPLLFGGDTQCGRALISAYLWDQNELPESGQTIVFSSPGALFNSGGVTSGGMASTLTNAQGLALMEIDPPAGGPNQVPYTVTASKLGNSQAATLTAVTSPLDEKACYEISEVEGHLPLSSVILKVGEGMVLVPPLLVACQTCPGPLGPEFLNWTLRSAGNPALGGAALGLEAKNWDQAEALGKGIQVSLRPTTQEAALFKTYGKAELSPLTASAGVPTRAFVAGTLIDFSADSAAEKFLPKSTASPGSVPIELSIPYSARAVSKGAVLRVVRLDKSTRRWTDAGIRMLSGEKGLAKALVPGPGLYSVIGIDLRVP